MSEFLQESIFDWQPPKEEKQNSDVIFSYSRISLYNECPLKYRFRYIEKIPEKPKGFLFIGRLIHKVLEAFFSKVPPPSLEEINEMIQSEWSKIPFDKKGFASQEYDEINLKKVINIMKNFYMKHKDNTKLPFLLEYSTNVKIDGYIFTIIADKIEYNGNGKITIVDYKTGKEGDRTPEQLFFYQKVCEADENLIKKAIEKYSNNIDRIEVDSMIYYYVENLKEIKYTRAKESEMNYFWERTIKTIENIVSSKFDPKPSEKSCRWCDYRNLCPVYISSSNSYLERMCDEYIELLEDYEKIKREIYELELKIIGEMKRTNKKTFSRATKIFSIEKKPKVISSSENKDEIIKILKENNLYEKSLRITMSSIIDILNDEGVNEDVKSKLKLFISEEEKLSITDQ